jgi:hypothetical protein
MKKLSHNSKKTMKRSKRSKKTTRRRRQRGGAVSGASAAAQASASALALTPAPARAVTPTPAPARALTPSKDITVGFTLNADNKITIKNISDTTGSVTAVPTGLNALTLKTTIPIKNISIGNAVAKTMGGTPANTGIHIVKADKMTDFIIPPSSYVFARPVVTPSQIKLDQKIGQAFPKGLLIRNLNRTNLNITSPLPQDVKMTLSTAN